MTTQLDEQITGEISVNTENILPIIKKWLYSEHEIFLRELISNGYDAISKLNMLAVRENLKDYLRDGKLDITVDDKANTITISDNGLGLDAEEVQKYINQIAFSGAKEFLEKYQDKAESEQIIGHFGLGFYSAFMVSDKVEIKSRSYKTDADPIHWECDGSTHFSIVRGDRAEVGTDIILHINEDNRQFVNEAKVKELVVKFANFLPIEITVNGTKANYQNPLWIKSPTELKDQDYIDFYKVLYPFDQDPLFWIHLNADYPFNVKGILYFPKLMHELDSAKGDVKLYCQQVFVTEQSKEIIPEFLTLLKGAIDCPDIPLNVSRSYLQNDPYVQKISSHIVKKVADKLNDIFKKDRNNFEKFWDDIHPFIKYGMMNNDDFHKRVNEIVIFKSSLGYSTTIPEYTERNKEKAENTVLYSTNKEQHATYIELLKEQGLEVIYLTSLIDTHFLRFLEGKNTEIKYKAVDSAVSDQLVDKSRESTIVDPTDNKTQKEKLEVVFKNALDRGDKLKIQVESLKNDDIPAIVLESEHVKRMRDMQAMFRGSMPAGMFEDYTLVLNSNNPIIKNVLKLHGEFNKEAQVKTVCEHVYDLAMMNQKPFTGEQMQAFMKRANEILKIFSEK